MCADTMRMSQQVGGNACVFIGSPTRVIASLGALSVEVLILSTLLFSSARRCCWVLRALNLFFIRQFFFYLVYLGRKENVLASS